MTAAARQPHAEQELLAVARDAAHAAGEVLLARFGDPEGVRTKSTATDLVSDADLAAEWAIRTLLAERRPDDAVLGEEGGESDGDGHVRWVVDPLDGTVNYLFGLPQWSVSIACEDGDGPIAGVVWDPLRQEEFAATRGGPATLNGAAIAASARSDLATALVATGFAYDAAIRARQAEVATRLLPRVRDIRRLGSAALDLAWTACGRCDAYFERGVSPWDIAAGALIAQRAGLELRALRARGPEAPVGLLAAPPALAAKLEALVAG